MTAQKSSQLLAERVRSDIFFNFFLRQGLSLKAVSEKEIIDLSQVNNCLCIFALNAL
ncbi:hypothetical protein MGI18_04395 [Bacillus sp. OVS6]|nr:hypothetical protein MGI18_04395 [Bacillus sp. OVS6]